jgi:hypothetical protein
MSLEKFASDFWATFAYTRGPLECDFLVLLLRSGTGLALIFRGQFSAVDCAHDLVLLHHSGELYNFCQIIRYYAFPD